MAKTHKICCAGFGGQGVMSMGMLLTYAGMVDEKYVTWYPNYGPEMRGGTANCVAVVSDEEIGSPVISNDATILVVMNNASLTKFTPALKSGGSLYINSSLVTEKVTRDDIKVYYVPANEMAADQLKNTKLANIIMIGSVNHREKIVSDGAVIEAFKKVFGAAKEKLIPLNKEAYTIGNEFARTI